MASLVPTGSSLSQLGSRSARPSSAADPEVGGSDPRGLSSSGTAPVDERVPGPDPPAVGDRPQRGGAARRPQLCIQGPDCASRPGRQFCLACGGKRAQLCSTCRVELAPGAPFCDGCGEELAIGQAAAVSGSLLPLNSRPPPVDQHLLFENPFLAFPDADDAFATLPSELAKQARLVHPPAIRALLNNNWSDAELNWFLPSSLQDRVQRVLQAKGGSSAVVVREGRLTVASTNRPPELTSATHAILAMDNLLRIRSALVPVTADSNNATWGKYRELFLDYEWNDVVHVFEQVRLACAIDRVLDWSAADCLTLLRAVVATRPERRADHVAAASSSDGSGNARKKAKINLPTKDYKVLLALCDEKGLCLKFQHAVCEHTGDHNDRRHACSTCDSVVHGSARCRSAHTQAPPSEGSNNKKRKATVGGRG